MHDVKENGWTHDRAHACVKVLGRIADALEKIEKRIDELIGAVEVSGGCRDDDNYY